MMLQKIQSCCVCEESSEAEREKEFGSELKRVGLRWEDKTVILLVAWTDMLLFCIIKSESTVVSSNWKMLCHEWRRFCFYFKTQAHGFVWFCFVFMIFNNLVFVMCVCVCVQVQHITNTTQGWILIYLIHIGSLRGDDGWMSCMYGKEIDISFNRYSSVSMCRSKICLSEFWLKFSHL
jgi:hypothetical protein